MRPIALVGLLSLAAQVAETTKRLERDEEMRPVLKAERAECEAVVSEYEWRRDRREDESPAARPIIGKKPEENQ
jgi:hypothetical protein